MKNLLLLVPFLFTSAAYANMDFCEGKTADNHIFRVTITKTLRPDKVTDARVEILDQDGNTVQDKNYEKLSEISDKHLNRLMTGPGISIKYENRYGILKNLVVTALTSEERIETINIDQCKPIDERYH